MGLLSVISNPDMSLECVYKWYIYGSSMLLIISSVIALLSFMPSTGKLQGNVGGPMPEDILMLYSDIVKYNEKEYIEEIYKRYFQIGISELTTLQPQELEYAKEIIYNAKITYNKYAYFKVSLIMAIIGIGGPIGVVGLCIHKYVKR